MSQPRPHVVLATRNVKKLAELRRILQAETAGVDAVGLDDLAAPYDEPPETEPTFEGNALVKARAAAGATQLPAVADDSGLCVDALNGMPGVLSARWAARSKDDDANNALLLAQLVDVPDYRRGAEFRCAMALALPGGEQAVEVGAMRGRLLRETRGDGGFGYDPVFVADGMALTNAELAAADKDAVSHRGRALRALLPALRRTLATHGPPAA